MNSPALEERLAELMMQDANEIMRRAERHRRAGEYLTEPSGTVLTSGFVERRAKRACESCGRLVAPDQIVFVAQLPTCGGDACRERARR